MLTLKLPDGSVRQVPPGTRPGDVAEGIGKRLAQAAVAAKVNGAIVDLDRELPAGAGEASFAILTDKDREALDVLRHSQRPRHGPGRHAALPRRPARLRPDHRERLLLRRRLARPRSREDDFPRIEAGDAEDRRAGRAVRAVRAARRRGPAARARTWARATRSSTSTTS